MRLSGRAVNGAGYAFIGAKRRPLTGEADGQAQALARKAEGRNSVLEDVVLNLRQ